MWGSCGSNGTVSLDWHLIFAPKKVMQYAVAHEVCHQIERNHTKRFWEMVRGLYGDFENAKAWLDENEHLLGYRKIPLNEKRPKVYEIFLCCNTDIFPPFRVIF